MSGLPVPAGVSPSDSSSVRCDSECARADFWHPVYPPTGIRCLPAGYQWIRRLLDASRPPGQPKYHRQATGCFETTRAAKIPSTADVLAWGRPSPFPTPVDMVLSRSNTAFLSASGSRTPSRSATRSIAASSRASLSGTSTPTATLDTSRSRVNSMPVALELETRPGFTVTLATHTSPNLPSSGLGVADLTETSCSDTTHHGAMHSITGGQDRPFSSDPGRAPYRLEVLLRNPSPPRSLDG